MNIFKHWQHYVSIKPTILLLVMFFIVSQMLTLYSPNIYAANTNPADAGAKLPISYDINTISGSKSYVATNGNDKNNGSFNAPYATLKNAINKTSPGGTIIVRSGIYRESNLSLDKSLTIVAYPGEVVEFRGSQKIDSDWSDSGSLRHHAYTPQPVTDGSGINFSDGQNLTGDGVGKYPDQAWVGSKQLKQVSSKSDVVEGKFYVDRSDKRIYLHQADVSKGSVEASKKDVFMKMSASNSKLKGIKITRYSNSADDYGVLNITGAADNSLLENVHISDSAFIAVQYQGGSNINKGSSMKNVTVTRSNWMGIGALYTDNLTLDAVAITNMNQFGEFKTSPQSGGLKTSRARYTKVVNSLVANNKGHGLWFDQSNYDVDVANSKIVNNAGSGVFFEISDDLLLINNYIKASGGARAVKLSGSSGIKLVNNTIIGGADPIGVYVDPRSMPGCAKPDVKMCPTEYSSDTDKERPWINTIDWIPRIDYMVNNIVAYPTSGGYCGGTVSMCIMSSNGSSKVAIETILHHADNKRDIPQTYMNGNVYANGDGKIINTSIGKFSTTDSFSERMAISPVNISGLEKDGKQGNQYVNPDGTPKAALNHNEAVAIPSDANINKYISKGTKYYGVLGVNTAAVPSTDAPEVDESTNTATNNSGASGADESNTNSMYSCEGSTSSECLQNNPIVEWINIAVNFLSGLIIALAILRLAFAGLQYMTARDNPQALADSKKGILNVFIGLIAFFFLYGFIQWLVPGGVF